MKTVYFDNASTSHPKAPGVASAIHSFIEQGSFNPSRGQYTGASATGLAIFELRKSLAERFGAPSPRQIIFTQNVTMSVNMLLKGLFQPGQHLIVSSMEHNSVMRPLQEVAKQGVNFTAVTADQDGYIAPEKVEAAILPQTRAIVMTAASNVCGTVMPLREIGQIARARGLYLIVDSAQAAGILPLTLNDLKADAICFTGHKSLLGPQGIGGLAISTEFNECKPLVTGGTGSSSHSEEVPTALPDRFEAGTQNLPGLIGLSAADKWLKGKEREILTHELELARHFINSIAEIKQVRLIGRDAMYCNPDQPGRIAAVSLDFPAEDNAEIAARLFDNYGIMTRCGLHCAPRAHKTLGTYPQGTVRFSFGWSNTRDEIDYAVSAIKNLVQR